MGLGIYLHIPFCISKCPYCDFNSYAVGQAGLEQTSESQYIDALLGELVHYAEKPTWRRRQVETIFFGGGTPSLLRPASIKQLLEKINSLFSLDQEVEITLETNPGTIFEPLGANKLASFKDLGINRISLGAQSFSNEKLKFLGRLHSSEETRAAIDNLIKAGFLNFNLDLMFGTRGEDLATWRSDLEQAISFTPTHLSVYGLTLEAGTEFFRQHSRGLPLLANEDEQAEMFQMTQELLEKQGYQQYEISNYSKAGYECQHNLGYWQGRDYLGLGAGAHSFSAREKLRWLNIPGTSHYISRISERGEARQKQEKLSKEQQLIEFFSLRLRTKNGFKPKDFEKLFQRDFKGDYQPLVSQLKAEELLLEKDNSILLSSKGFLFADTVISAFCD